MDDRVSGSDPMGASGPPQPGPPTQPGYAPGPLPPPYGTTPPPPPGYVGSTPSMQPPQPWPPGSAGPQQAGPYGPPQAPPAPRKSRRGCLVAAIVAAVVVLGLAATCVLVVPALLGSSGATIRQAETHYRATISALDTATASLRDAASEPKDAAMKTDLGRADAALRTARDEVVATRLSVGALPDSSGKSQYLDSLTSMNRALDASQRLAAYLNVAAQMSAKMSQAAAAGKKGNSDLGAAISASNANNFTVMRRKAQSASANYAKSAVLFREADRLDTSAGIELLAAFADKRKQEADLQVRMAYEGANHAVKTFNKDVDQARALRRQADAIPDPAIVKTGWLANRIKPMTSQMTDALTRAESLHTKALGSLGYKGTDSR